MPIESKYLLGEITEMKALFRSKLFWLLVAVFVVLEFIWILSADIVATKQLFSDSTGLYFHSALLQANAAILSIVGLFVVFKIQSHQSSIANVRAFVQSQIRSSRGIYLHDITDFEGNSLEEKEIWVQEKKPKVDPYVLALFEIWIANEKRSAQIRLLSRFPTELLAGGIIANAVGLLTASVIHECGVKLEGSVLCFFLFLEVCIVYVIMNVILQIMADE